MASTLRRRLPGIDNPSDTPTPRDESSDEDGNLGAKLGDVKAVHVYRPKTRKRRNTAIFLLGSLFGIIAAGFFAKSNDLIGFPELGELTMDSFLDVLPAGLVKDMRELIVRSISVVQTLPAARHTDLSPPGWRARFPRKLRRIFGRFQSAL